MTMMNSSIRTNTFNFAAGKLVAAVALASLLGGLSISPALADDHDSRSGYNQGRHDGKKHRDNRRDWRHERYEGRSYRPERYQRPYYQPYEVYSPPAVIYAPPRSPGVSLFFPIDIH